MEKEIKAKTFLRQQKNVRERMGKKIHLLMKQQTKPVQCHCSYERRQFRAAAILREDQGQQEMKTFNPAAADINE